MLLCSSKQYTGGDMFDSPTILWAMICYGAIILYLFNSSLVFLSISLGGLSTYLFLEFQLIQHHLMLELIIFLLISFAWFASLWFPIEKFSRLSKISYDSLIGKCMIVASDRLSRDGVVGDVEWNDSLLKAKYIGEDDEDVKRSELVVVLEVHENVLHVVKFID